MPDRGTPRNTQPAGGRSRPTDARRRAPQSSQEREGERSDSTHPGDFSEPQQARRRHDQEFVNERDLVTQVEDEEGEADEDEKDGLGPRP